MKSLFIGSMLLSSMLMFVSCRKEEAPSGEQNEVSADIISKIKAKGFNTTGVKKWEDGYLVEGDILLKESELNGKIITPGEVHTEQYIDGMSMVPLPVTLWGQVNSSFIVIAIDPALPAVYTDALNTAIYRFNSVLLRRHMSFSVYPNTYWDQIPGGVLKITTINDPNASRAISGFPSGGYQYTSIKLNTNAAALGSNPDVNYLASVIQHELGHCIGFRHTDLADGKNCGTSTSIDVMTSGGFSIPNTSSSDASSWMSSCLAFGTDRTFTTQDIYALNYLYGMAEGSFVRDTASGAIYIYMEGKLRHIQDFATYSGVFGNPYNVVREFFPPTFAFFSYTFGDPITSGTKLMLDAATGKRYFAVGTNTLKRYISGTAFTKYHFSTSAVVTASAAELAAYPTGPDLQ
ncbi:M57 family metalloprotease [Chitinophaga sp. CF418]|uniref:M57 family metalloprotease n=1 Tax=Chitinophaga sp. CF418 TaxID=1855287 RepID=UPI00091548F8|nr:M57 family metalloprotease [Chitinophaga sp. CF418]SHN24146.1 Dual-action HEIGH metallo-peptidase [Chitinophaga sp. CF418]